MFGVVLASRREDGLGVQSQEAPGVGDVSLASGGEIARSHSERPTGLLTRP
jgi:hypothetical protein